MEDIANIFYQKYDKRKWFVSAGMLDGTLWVFYK